MPRLNPTRAAPARQPARQAGARGKSRKPAAPDRLSSSTLFFRRIRRSVKPGLWVLGAAVLLFIGSELFRAIPAIGPVASPAGSLRHGFGALAADFGFRITAIEINGADTTPKSVVEAALGVRRGDPILGFSLASAAARIAALGPIQTATVERALPHSLIVTVTERAPYAVWQTAGAGTAPKFVVIDKNGKVIADQDAVTAKRRDPALLLLAGQDAPQNAGDLMNELTAFPAVRSHVAAAARVDGLRWNLILRNNTLVKLPGQNEPQAIARLSQLQASIALLDRPVEVIDLRFSGRLVVRPYPNAEAVPVAAPSPAAHS